MRDAYAGDVPIIIEETQPAGAEEAPMPPADAAAAPAADAGHSDTDVSVPSPASPVPQPAAAQPPPEGMQPDDAFQRWLRQQHAVVAHVAVGRSGMPAQVWAGLGTTSCGKAPHVKAPSVIQAAYGRGQAAYLPPALQGPALGTPEVGAGNPAAGAAAQMVDREALPKDPPVVDLAGCDSPTPAAPAGAAALANAADAARASAAKAVGAALASELTTAEMLERMAEELHACHRGSRRLGGVAGGGCTRREGQEERRRLEAENAGWRRQQAEEQAAQAARDARLAELVARILANCEEILAEAKYVLDSLRRK